MITPTNTFYKRILSDWKFQYDVWRMAIDWTVALYIVIPVLFLGIYRYVELWQTGLPLLSIIPVQLFAAVIFISAWKGTVRIFFEEADQLFLRQQKNWLNQIKRLSIFYYILLKFCSNSFIFLLLAPVLLRYQLKTAEFLQLFILSFLIGVCLNFSQQLLSLVLQGVKGVIAQAALFILAGALFVYAISTINGQPVLFTVILILLLTASGLLISKRLMIKGAFFEDVNREQYARLRYLNLLLKFVSLDVKRPLLKGKQPILFPRSNPLFKKRHAVNCLAELGIKAILRDFKNIFQYLQMLFVLILVVLAFPAEWMLLLLAAFAVLFAYFVRSYWQEFIGSEFVSLFPGNDDISTAAAKKFIFTTTLPGFMVISFIAGFVAYSWPGAICGMLAGAIMAAYFSFKFIYLLRYMP